VLSLRAGAGGWELADSLTVAVPEGGRVQPSGIVMTADARFLFGALRGVDEVLGLAFDPVTGALTQTGRWPSGSANPRDLTLSPGGRFLLVAHQDGKALSLHPVDPATGHLTGPPRTHALHTPMLIKFAVFGDS
jgi:6-phosphogluconolactonase